MPPDGIVEIPSIPIYNATRTITGWYYHDGVDRIIINLGLAYLSVESDTLSSTGITGANYFVNGYSSGSLDFGWNHIAITTAIPFNSGPTLFSVVSAAWAKYSEEKTEAELNDIYLRSQARMAAQGMTI
jgi:hypothetical protein